MVGALLSNDERTERTSFMSSIIGQIKISTFENLGLPNRIEEDILVGEQNLRHMMTRHPEDFNRFKFHIREIICHPDYVNLKKDKSIQFIKRIDPDIVLVAVATSNNGYWYARTIYCITQQKFDQYLVSGYLKNP